MKRMKKLLAVLFSVIFVFSMVFVNTITVKAVKPYTYKIKIVLGGTGDEGAEFNKDLGITVPTGVTVDFADAEKSTIVIDNIQYNDRVSIDPSKLVKITPKTRVNDDGQEVQYQKYCVKGLRFSGQNTVMSGASFNVTYDETFVVAYGVGEIVPYKVNYVHTDGSPIVDPEGDGTKTIQSITGYALAGEELYVPYRAIPGYKPNTYNYHTKSLKAPTVDDEGNEKPFEFTFYYSSKNSSSTIETTTEVIETSTVQGDSEYTYQTVSRGTTVNNPAVTNNRPAAGGGAGAGDADNGEGGADDGAAAGDTTITDDETPQDIIEIDDEETAKAGAARDNFVRNMIIAIIIAIIAIVAVLVALLIAGKKRKAQVAQIRDNKKDRNE